MHLTFFGSSLVSSYWNGAATYYRGLLRALHGLGHTVTFCEPDAYGRQERRDLEEDPPYARVVVYRTEAERDALVAQAFGESDWVVKCSGVGVWDAELEAAVAERSGGGVRTAFLDVDAPATLGRMAADPATPSGRWCRATTTCSPTAAGRRWWRRTPAVGRPRVHADLQRAGPGRAPAAGAPADPEFDLLFMGNRLPDREARVDEFFFRAALWCRRRGSRWAARGGATGGCRPTSSTWATSRPRGTTR
jgi:spore maturation protein CgeB